MRVAVVAEYYPRPGHPGLGIWAHCQAVAAAQEGAEVRVIALDRPLPPLHAMRSLGPGGGRPDPGPLRQWWHELRSQPRSAELDGIEVTYARFLSPPRPLSYGSWGRWAAPAVGRALDSLDRNGGIDLVHAHYAVPSGAAARRWIERRRPGLPLVVSVHGGDLSYAAPRSRRGHGAVTSTLRGAEAVIANSTLTRDGIEALIGPREHLYVIHPGADVAPGNVDKRPQATLVTVAHLEPHKSQADVIGALAALHERHPELRYVLIGRGPDRSSLETLARSLGVEDRVEFMSALPHEQAMAELARCHLHVMPSRHDAFGVAHIEAMAAGVPTIAGEGTGARDIVAAGEGALLVPAGNVNALAGAIDTLLSEPGELRRLGEAARQTAFEHFSWKRCGRQTADVYREVSGVANPVDG